jgi:hypothetical protein
LKKKNYRIKRIYGTFGYWLLGASVLECFKTSILLIQGIITDHVKTIHLYAAGLEIISITAGLGALDVPLLPLF